MQKLHLSLVLFTCLLSLEAVSQFTVHGRVIDSITREPLNGASVYCQNTTIGTTTNRDGAFSLQLKSGGYELIVSFTGYQNHRVQISGSNAEIPDIEMIKEEKSLGEVIIKSSNEVKEGWDKYGSFFLKHFIGNTANAKNARLLNPEVLKFYLLKRSNKLRVLATEPLQIENLALGYMLRFQLDSFIYNYDNDINSYVGYCLFTELEGDDSLRAAWTVNRKKAYDGSKLHFLRSYYDSTVIQEGFVIDILNKGSTSKFSRIRNIYDTQYYGVLDSTNEVEIWFPQKISVGYLRQKPEPEYLKQYRLPEDVPIQLSYIDLTNAIVIMENGYYYEQKDWVNQGYWSWKNLADLLPYDYSPY